MPISMESILWVWTYCQARQRLTYFDYSVIVTRVLQKNVKVSDSNRFFYSDDCHGGHWRPCNSGHIKYMIGASLILIQQGLLKQAQKNNLGVPSGWCGSRLRKFSNAGLSQILSLCKENFHSSELMEVNRTLLPQNNNEATCLSCSEIRNHSSYQPDSMTMFTHPTYEYVVVWHHLGEGRQKIAHCWLVGW